MKHAWILQENQTSTTEYPLCIQIAKGGGGDYVLSQLTHKLYRKGNCAKCQLTVTVSPSTEGAGADMDNWEHMTLGGVGLDLNGAWAAKKGPGLIV